MKGEDNKRAGILLFSLLSLLPRRQTKHTLISNLLLFGVLSFVFFLIVAQVSKRSLQHSWHDWQAGLLALLGLIDNPFPVAGGPQRLFSFGLVIGRLAPS